MGKGIRVLLVDDEAQFRVTASKLLTKRGFHTVIAASGEEALDILAANPVDVAVLDMMMPGMGGLEALARIRRISPSTRVIILTAFGSLASAKTALDRGAFDFLTKPCDMDLLESKILLAVDGISETLREGEKVLEEATVGDIMVPVEHYVRIDTETTVCKAVSELKKTYGDRAGESGALDGGHRSVLVYEPGGQAVGILSIADLLSAIRPAYLLAPKPSLADSMQYSPLFWRGLFTRRTLETGERRVKDIMSDLPPRIDVEANLMEAAERMVRENTRRLAVTLNQVVVGILGEKEMFFIMSKILEKPSED